MVRHTSREVLLIVGHTLVPLFHPCCLNMNISHHELMDRLCLAYPPMLSRLSIYRSTHDGTDPSVFDKVLQVLYDHFTITVAGLIQIPLHELRGLVGAGITSCPGATDTVVIFSMSVQGRD